MKFEFSFEKLLDHKKTLEDVAKRNWAEKKALLDAELEKLDQMYQLIDDSRKRAMDLAITGGAQGPMLVGIDEFINGQKIRIERHRSQIRELMAEVERLHELLVEAAKERKTLEKLRERKLEEFRLLRRKKEAKEIDELVVTRFGKNLDGSKQG